MYVDKSYYRNKNIGYMIFDTVIQPEMNI